MMASSSATSSASFIFCSISKMVTPSPRNRKITWASSRTTGPRDHSGAIVSPNDGARARHLAGQCAAPVGGKRDQAFCRAPSKDEQFEAKFWDVIGLYLDPPEKALVLCCDEKSPCQVPERTQPGLPLGVGLTRTSR